MPTFRQTNNPLQSMGVFLSAIAARDNRFLVDQPRAMAWLEDIGDLDMDLCKRAVQSHYKNPERCIYEIKAGHIIAYVNSCAPKVEMCQEHAWMPKNCASCRAERLELGTEKAIGQSTVPQLSGRAVPMPDYIKNVLKGIPQ